MSYYVVKILVTTALVVVISEVARRSSFIGAVLASIPLVSLLAMIWLYVDTRDVGKVSALASSIFWLVLPSLALFVTLPLLLKQGLNFYASIGISIAVTVVCYLVVIAIAEHFGVRL